MIAIDTAMRLNVLLSRHHFKCSIIKIQASLYFMMCFLKLLEAAPQNHTIRHDKVVSLNPIYDF